MSDIKLLNQKEEDIPNIFNTHRLIYTGFYKQQDVRGFLPNILFYLKTFNCIKQ